MHLCWGTAPMPNPKATGIPKYRATRGPAGLCCSRQHLPGCARPPSACSLRWCAAATPLVLALPTPSPAV
jgi:hypothetical protein